MHQTVFLDCPDQGNYNGDDSQHLLSTYYVPGTVWSRLHVWSHWILKKLCLFSLLSFPLHRLGNQELEKINLSKVTHLVHVRAMFSPGFLTPKLTLWITAFHGLVMLCYMNIDLLSWTETFTEPHKLRTIYFSLPALFSRLTSCPGDTGSLVLASGKGDLKCHITANPFKVDLVSEEEVVMSINSLGQLYFEQLQIPPKQRYFCTLLNTYRT